MFGFPRKVLGLDGERVDIGGGGVRIVGKHAGERQRADAVASPA